MKRPRPAALLALCLALLLAGCSDDPDATGGRDGGPIAPPPGAATLDALGVSAGRLVPDFDPAVHGYTLDLSVSDASLTVTPHGPADTRILVDDQALPDAAGVDLPLAVGARQIVVEVRGAGGELATYSINAFRGVDALVELRLSLGTLTPAFTPERTAYAIEVPSVFASLAVQALPLRDDGTTVRIQGQQVNGAATRDVPLVLGTNHLAIVVAHGGESTTYTLDVERALPLVQQAKLVAEAPRSSARLGTRVALDGDTLVAAAPEEDNHAGAVYVFVRQGGTWHEEARLVPANPGAGDAFGTSVALSGDTLVVGAPFEDGAGTNVGSVPDDRSREAGAAYVFVRQGGAWSQQAYLKATNTGSFDDFGASVAVDGDTVAVGAPGEEGGGIDASADPGDNTSPLAGAVYVYTRVGTQWFKEAYLKSHVARARQTFGGALALAGDTLVVGADGNFLDEGVRDGAAYVLVRTASQWRFQATLSADRSTRLFGYSLAIDGDTIVVGAPEETLGSAERAGAAYVFARRDGQWANRGHLVAANAGLADLFGTDVAIAGTTILAGAPGEDSGSTGVDGTPNDALFSSGAAYRFEAVQGIWGQTGYLKALDPHSDDRYGTGVAISGPTLAVGAPFADLGSPTVSDGGAVYVLE